MNSLPWFLLAATVAFAQDARQIMAEAQKRARADSQRYFGTLQVLDSKGKVTDKKWEYDRIGSAGESKAILRFTAPPEVKGVALLIFNHPDRASDQWMWTPSINRERRIAFQDRSTRFFGTDFSFEDLEERDVDQYSYRLLGEETVDGAACWKIESKPKASKSSQYTQATLWVRKDYYLVWQIESFKASTLVRRLKYREPERVQGIWTPRLLEMSDFTRNSRTILKIEKLQYNILMKEQDFTLQALRRES